MLNYWMDISDPFRVLGEMRRHIDQAFLDYGGGRRTQRRGGPSHAGWPRVTLDETSDGFVLRALVPGLATEDLKLAVTAESVTLSGARPVEAPERYTAHRKERAPYTFTRTIELPAKVDVDNITASAKDGVLTVQLPRSPDSKPRVIEINVV